MKTIFRSHRWRIQAWYGLLLLLVIMGSILPPFHLLWENMMQRVDRDLARVEREVFRALLEAVQEAPGAPVVQNGVLLPEELIRRLDSETPRLPPDLLARFQGNEPGYAYFAVRSPAGKVVARSDNAPPDVLFLPVLEGGFNESFRTAGMRRESSRTSPHGLQAVVGRDIRPELDEMQSMAWWHGGIGLCVWLFGLLGGWWLSGRAIRPIRTISETATRIAAGNLEERIDTRSMATELAGLSEVLNATFERLHASFERQRQFTADASHELRTPLTILLSETQRVLKRERGPEEYREALETCAASAQRMRKLVEALLLLARQEARDPRAVHQPFDLAEVVGEVVSQHAPLAESLGRELSSTLVPTPCFGDPGAVAVLAANLVVNALQHGGHVTVTCEPRDGAAVLIVADDGPGIPADLQPHIFERFFRADTARTGGSGHSGLGLAIARAVAENHQGTLHLVSESGQGATFIAKLPGGSS